MQVGGEQLLHGIDTPIAAALRLEPIMGESVPPLLMAAVNVMGKSEKQGACVCDGHEHGLGWAEVGRLRNWYDVWDMAAIFRVAG